MGLRGIADGGHRRHEHHAAVEDVRSDGQQQDDDQRSEGPVDQEGQEGQLEHVEADVTTELVVGRTEALRVPEQQPFLPATNRRGGQQQCKECGDAVAHETQSTTEDLVEAFDIGVDVRRELLGCQAVGHEQVDPGEQQEDHEESDEEQRLGSDRSPEHVGATERLVPQIIDVEACDGTPEDQNEGKDSAEDDQDTTAADSAPWRVDRKVLRAPHWRPS